MAVMQIDQMTLQEKLLAMEALLGDLRRRMQTVRAGTARSRSFDRVFADLDRRF